MFRAQFDSAMRGLEVLVGEHIIDADEFRRLADAAKESHERQMEYHRYWDFGEELYRLQHPGGDFSVLTKERQMPYINMVKKIREADL